MIPVITLLYNGIARLVNTGADMENLFMAFMYYGTGLLFMVIGNYLPKVKQNHTIGIRVIWTLQDEENWNATHRFSGKLWMASGILCMLCGLFEESMAALVLYIVSIMAAAIKMCIRDRAHSFRSGCFFGISSVVWRAFSYVSCVIQPLQSAP